MTRDLALYVAPKAVCLTLILTLTSTGDVAQAAIPQCATHLQEPGADGIFTPQQLAMNAACIQALADFQKVAEAKAKIEDVEHRKDKNNDIASARSAPVIPNYPGVALPPAMLPPVQRSTEARPADTSPPKAQPAAPKLPVIVMILSDEKERPTATLRMPDGNSIEVTRGSLLPDGASVAAIEGNAVYVRRGHTLSRLAMDGGQGPTQGQANSNPSAANSVFGPPVVSNAGPGYPRGGYP